SFGNIWRSIRVNDCSCCCSRLRRAIPLTRSASASEGWPAAADLITSPEGQAQTAQRRIPFFQRIELASFAKFRFVSTASRSVEVALSWRSKSRSANSQGSTNPFDQDQCITGHNVLKDYSVPFVLSGARALRACSVK